MKNSRLFVFAAVVVFLFTLLGIPSFLMGLNYLVYAQEQIESAQTEFAQEPAVSAVTTKSAESVTVASTSESTCSNVIILLRFHLVPV